MQVRGVKGLPSMALTGRDAGWNPGSTALPLHCRGGLTLPGMLLSTVRTRENVKKWLKQSKNKQTETLFLDAQMCAGPFQNLAIPLCLSIKEKLLIVGWQSPKVLAGQAYPFLASLIN